jgi:hypothetical protein
MGDSSAAISLTAVNRLKGSGGPKEEGDTKGLFQKTPRKDLTGPIRNAGAGDRDSA